MRLGRTYAWASITQVAALAAVVCAQLLLARALGPSERARLGFQTSLTFLSSQILSLGIHWGIAVRVAQGDLRIGDAVRISFASSVAVGLVYAVGMWSIAPLLKPSLHVSGSEAALGGVAAAGTSMMSAAAGLANATKHFVVYNKATVLWRTAPLAVIVPFALMHRLDMPVALGATAFGSWLGAVVILGIAYRGMLGSTSSTFAIWRSTLPLGLRALGANAFVYAQQRIDVIIAAAILAPRQAGTYVVLAAIAEMTVSPAQAMANVL